MQARMKNPAMILPGAMQALQALNTVIESGSVPSRTLGLVHLRASQINGSRGLTLAIATVDVWNRLNITTRQVAGAYLAERHPS